MAPRKQATDRSSPALQRDLSKRVTDHHTRNVKFRHAPQDVEAARMLVLLSRHPVHRNRKVLQHARVASKPLAVPKKQVRFDVGPSAATADSLPETTGGVGRGEQFIRALRKPIDYEQILEFEERHNFWGDYKDAMDLVWRSNEPLHPVISSGKKKPEPVLTAECMEPEPEFAARTTKWGKHASQPASPLSNTRTATITDTPGPAKQHPNKRNMSNLWTDSNSESGFLPFAQLDEHRTDSVFSDHFVDQAETNKALFAAIDKMHDDITRTCASNQALYDHVGMLKVRVSSLELENRQLKATIQGMRGPGGPKRQPPKLSLKMDKLDLNDRPMVNKPSAENLSGTTIAFPSRPSTASTSAFPSVPLASSGVSSSTGSSFAEAMPLSSLEAAATTTNMPITPGSRTVLYKKDKHDLTGKLPPASVRLPLVPLTDVELIVFFYNCTARPIVSVRLYARGGPVMIAQTINDHRVVKPEGYKRNTCSVHCNKAVKTFIRLHGEDHKKAMSTFFEHASDADATDAIRHKEDELPDTCDFPVLGLFKDLIKMPSDGQGGVFTDCIKWCRENQVSVNLSKIHLVADALAKGVDPRDSLKRPGHKMKTDTTMVDAADDTDDVTGDNLTQQRQKASSTDAVDEISDLASPSDCEVNQLSSTAEDTSIASGTKSD